MSNPFYSTVKVDRYRDVNSDISYPYAYISIPSIFKKIGKIPDSINKIETNKHIEYSTYAIRKGEPDW